MTIKSERLAALRKLLDDMKERPPAAGCLVTFHADEVEQFLDAVAANGSADLFSLNQKQADKIDALTAQAEQDAATIAAQVATIEQTLPELRAEISAKDATIVDQAAEIERLKKPSMGDDVVGDTPQS